MSDADVKLDIGRELTRGLGAGADPEVGRGPRRTTRTRSPKLSRSRHGVRHRRRGRRHRNGRRPRRCPRRPRARRAHHGSRHRPFGFEGRRRPTRLRRASRSCKEEVDTLIVIPNDRLLSIADSRLSVLGAFAAADQVLQGGVQGITDLITTPGLINVDFNDVKSVMKGAGTALMGVGSARGEDRALEAAEGAYRVAAARGIDRGRTRRPAVDRGWLEPRHHRGRDAARLVREAAHPEANIIFGTVIDDTLGDEIRITVIAAGFDSGEPMLRIEPVGVTRPVRVPCCRPPRLKRSLATWTWTPRRRNLSRSPSSASQRIYLRRRRDLDIPDFLK